MEVQSISPIYINFIDGFCVCCPYISGTLNMYEQKNCLYPAPKYW